MSELQTDVSAISPSIPNGSAAAAILAAGIGIFVFAVTAFAGDKSPAIKSALIFYKPTGPLSGVAAIGVVCWILCWAVLEWCWGKKTVSGKSVCTASLVLLALSLLLTFPPIVDLL
jgi:hypothetical protein